MRSRHGLETVNVFVLPFVLPFVLLCMLEELKRNRAAFVDFGVLGKLSLYEIKWQL